MAKKSVGSCHLLDLDLIAFLEQDDMNCNINHHTPGLHVHSQISKIKGIFKKRISFSTPTYMYVQ